MSDTAAADDGAPKRWEHGEAVELVQGEVVAYEPSGWTRGENKDPPHRFKFDDLKKAVYVRLIRAGMRRVHAAEQVGVAYTTVLEHFRRFPDFAQAVSEAEMARLDLVEEALYETAIGGNVVAQQVVLYNRRPEEWADQRMMRARIEAAAVAEERMEARKAEKALGGLRDKLGELRERLLNPDEELPDLKTDDDEDAADDEYNDDDIVYTRVHAVPDEPTLTALEEPGVDGDGS